MLVMLPAAFFQYPVYTGTPFFLEPVPDSEDPEEALVSGRTHVSL